MMLAMYVEFVLLFVAYFVGWENTNTIFIVWSQDRQSFAQRRPELEISQKYEILVFFAKSEPNIAKQTNVIQMNRFHESANICIVKKTFSFRNFCIKQKSQAKFHFFTYFFFQKWSHSQFYNSAGKKIFGR